MASTVRDSFADVERLRQNLEQNIEKLQKSLQHWQTWEFEYEAFREELTTLSAKSSRSDLVDACKSFEGELVNQKEVNELSGRDKGIERTRDQIVNLISRRVDYVKQNINTIQKQLDQTRLKRDRLSVISKPDVRSEEGLPITEILEELDEDGNVISGRLIDPNNQTPQMLEALKKVGVDVEAGAESGSSSKTTRPGSDGVELDSNYQSLQNPPLPQSAVGKDSPNPNGSPSPKKTVSFASDTKAPSSSVTKKMPKSSPDKSSLTKDSFASTDRVIELDENDNIASTIPGAPINESAEDAALRREMLQYSMSEVGSIVAELDLEDQGETDDEIGSDEVEWGEISNSDEGELSDEDEHGLSRRTGMSDVYRQEMLELEQKMQARMMENVGPKPPTSAANDSELAQSVRRLRVQDEAEINDEEGIVTEEPPLKAVRFEEQPTTEKHIHKPVSSPSPPMHDSVIERSRSIDSPSTTPSFQPQTQPQRKPSRFKADRLSSSKTSATSTTAPVPPPNQPLASVVRERSPQRIPQPPSDLDANVVQDELRVAYDRQKQKMIRQQNGAVDAAHDLVVGDNDMPREVYEDMEDDEAAPKKKMSKFKAARMQRDRVW